MNASFKSYALTCYLQQPLFRIAHVIIQVSASTWLGFEDCVHVVTSQSSTYRSKGVESSGICIKMLLFQACPNSDSQVHVRKLACRCGHVFRGSKPLTTRNASRKSDVSAARALETEEQTTYCNDIVVAKNRLYCAMTKMFTWFEPRVCTSVLFVPVS